MRLRRHGETVGETTEQTHFFEVVQKQELH
jgi:hypothetical protein